MVVIENKDSRKYFVCSKNERFFLTPGGICATEGDVTLFRTYSRIYPIHLLLKTLLFVLCVLFVFFDTDYQNGDVMLISVSYKCSVKSDSTLLTLQCSHLMNITKKGNINAEFCINKCFLIAHVISVFLYSLFAIALFVLLGIFTRGEALSPIFFVLAGLSAAGGGYMCFFTIKKLLKTLHGLRRHYRDYSYW